MTNATTTRLSEDRKLRKFKPVNGKRRKKGVHRAATIAIGIAFLAIWEILPRAGVVSPLVLPPATEVIDSLVALLQSENFWHHFQVSMEEILLGFVLATIIGLVGGGLLAISKTVKEITYGYVVTFQAVPKIVLAPIFITWFGYGQSSKVVMAVTISFFPVLLNTMVGLASTPPEAIKLMRSLNANQWQIFRRVMLPFALPLISAGIKTALTFAVIGAIVGEFVGAREGLGFLVDSYNFQMRTDAVFALIVVLAVVSVVMYFLVEWLDRRLIHWEDRT